MLVYEFCLLTVDLHYVAPASCAATDSESLQQLESLIHSPPASASLLHTQLDIKLSIGSAYTLHGSVQTRRYTVCCFWYQVKPCCVQ